MKISEMNNCIEKMREVYKFDDDKTEIRIGDMISGSSRYVAVGTIMDYKGDCTFEEALDRVEHPQPFYDIAECICDELKAIERERLFYKNKLMDLRLRCHDSARNIFDSGNYGVLHMVTANELKSYNN